ncbi:spore germination protein GerPB [Halobacillus litoralis]|uniref:spore germination protein GerPB n=1 Tax=Halobacillus litoralis TaxID=45668 RepID=UPI001CD2DED5|nr:spore germination protein GerPB [Halobacillus litoralis]MCA0969632.1 spore germination protein GerPB [Halobacillus litoralis]
MAWTVHQCININILRIGSVSNSSIVQIGSSGVIQAKSDLFNTGAFTEPAAPAQPAGGSISTGEAEAAPLVPLSLT